MTGATKQQIVIAVQVDGQQVITDLNAELDRAGRIMEQYAKQVAAGTITAAEYAANTKNLAADIHKTKEALVFATDQWHRQTGAYEQAKIAAEAARVAQKAAADQAAATAKAAADAAKAQATAVAEMESRMKGGAFAILAMSHAAQDLAQSGFGAIINNIPLVVSGLGQLAGLSTTVQMISAGVGMLGGVVALQVAPAFKSWMESLTGTEAHIQSLQPKLEQLKKTVEDLEKHRKLGLDFSGLDEAKRKLDELTAKHNAWLAISGATSVQDEAGKAMSRGITEGGGKMAVAGAIADVMKKEGTFFARSKNFEKWKSVKSQREGIERDLASGTLDLDVAAGLSATAARLKNEQATLEAGMTQEGMEYIQDTMVGGAMTGSDAMRRRMLEMYQGNKGAFAARGVTAEFETGLLAADPAYIKDIRQNAKDAESQTAMARLNRALDAKGLGALNQQGRAADAAMRKAKLEENAQIDALNDQGKAAQEEMERILDVEKKDEAGKKARIRKWDAENRANHAEAMEQVRKHLPGFDDDIEQALITKMQGGQTLAQARASIEPQLAQRLGQRGVMGSTRNVAGIMINEVWQRMQNQDPSRQMAAGLQAQFQAGGFGAASEGLAKRTVSLMEQGVDQASATAAAVNELQARLNRVEQQLRQNASKLNSSRQRRGTLLNNFPAGRD